MANVVEVVLKGVDLTGPPFARAIQTFTNVGKAAKGMFAVFAAGAVIGGIGAVTEAFAENTLEAIKSADELGRLSQQAATSVRDFSQLSVAAGLAEVSSQELVTATKKLSDELVNQGRGSESVIDEMMRLADQFAATDDSAAKTTLAVQKFGKAGQSLIPFLNQGSAAIREQMEEADKFGLTVGAKFAENADQFLDNVDRMKNALRGLWMQVAQDVLPTLVELSEKTIQWIKHGDNLEKIAQKIGFTFNFMLRAGEDLASLKTVASGLIAPFATTATIISDAWMKATEDMKRAREEMDKAKNAGGGKAEIINEQDVEKALQLYDKLKLERMRGAEAVRETERQAFYDRLDQISKWQISEEQALNLIGDEYLNYQLRLNEITREGEDTRAQLEEYYRDGRLAAYINLLNSQQGANLAWLEAIRGIAQTYNEIWNNSFARLNVSLINFASSAIRTFSDGFGTAIANIVTGAQTAEQAFKALGQQMLTMLVKWIAQMAINTALGAIMQATLSKTALAAMAPVLAMNTAAATAASIATLGGATAAGSLVVPVMSANVALAEGLFAGIGGAAHGGLDFVPAETTYLLQYGERVLSPRQNVRFEQMLDDWESGASPGGSSSGVIVVQIGDQPFADLLYRMSRNGTLQIDPRSVRT